MKPIFLDRDGVINADMPGDYVKNWGEFRFLPDALRALSDLTRNGFDIIIISNQQGVGKGLMSYEDLMEIDKRMKLEVERAGGRILDSFYCTHLAGENCDCRKPKPGLIVQASKRYSFEPRGKFFIGDSLRDMEAGNAVGCRTILLARDMPPEANIPPASRPEFLADGLGMAVEIVLREQKGIPRV